jgi:tryptophan-rich sensory protein
MKFDLKKALRLLSAIGFCQIAGIVGSIFTAPNISTWYSTLNKPSFMPPNWLFGPVWLTLYTLMGISLYLVWESKKEKKIAIGIFAVQLALNTLWSILFFGLKSPLYGLITIFLLWILILTTIIEFYKISKLASYLLVPYIFWVTLATALNYFVWALN